VKKYIHLLAVIFSFIVLVSCQKEPDENLLPNSSSNRVKTYTESVTSPNGNYSTTFNLSYDNQGRVIAVTSASSPGDKFVYGYPSNGLYTMDIYNSGAVVLHEDFYLNAASLVDSTMQYNDTKDTTTEDYTYNANNQLITLEEYHYSKSTGGVLFNTTTYTYGANGNLLRSEDTEGLVETYEYYADLSYAPPINVGPITVASTRKVNLTKKHTMTYFGNVFTSADFTYTFDSKDRIMTERGVHANGTVVTKSFTYF
jgi:hypothetical protein